MNHPESINICAGFGRVEISPGPECPLIGYSQREDLFGDGNAGLLDPLFARAVLFEQAGNVRALLISLDLCIVEDPCAVLLRETAATAAGMDPRHVMLCCTHTHSGPYPWQADWLEGDSESVPDPLHGAASQAYMARLLSGVAEAARAAVADLAPATLRCKMAKVGFAYRRRVLTPDGIRMCWNREEQAHLQPEPADDDNLVVLQIQRAGGDILIFNTAGHAVVLGKTSNVISADWPGAACAQIEELLPGSHAMFLHGAGGDAHPWVATTAAGDAPALVARTISGLVALLARSGGDAATSVPAFELREERFLAGKNAVNLQFWKIGPVRIAAFPCELFGSTGLELRAASPEPLLLATTANGWRGYWPPETAFEEGGYEVESVGSFGIQSGDAERLVAAMSAAFVRVEGGKPLMPRHPKRLHRKLSAVSRLLQDGEWTRLEGAPQTETALRDFHGGGEIWYVASGTAALEAILLGHEIGPGDEVITTPYTWGATVSAILAIGAVPVFADIDRETGLMDPESIPRLVNARTKALLVVHLFGWPCDMTRLRAIAEEAGICLLEDGSQAHGARWQGTRVGRFGAASAFSCMALKPLAGTEGGYAIFEKQEVAERAYLHGRHPRGLDPAQARRLGEARLLDSLQLGWRPCAVGAELVRQALPSLDRENAARRENARLLRRLLHDVPGVWMPEEPEGCEPVYHLMSLLHDPTVTGLDRGEFLKRLSGAGLETFVYIPTPIHRLRRMDWRDKDQPEVFWRNQLATSKIVSAESACPGADWRSAHAFEMGWNWTHPDAAAMEWIAGVIRNAVSNIVK